MGIGQACCSPRKAPFLRHALCGAPEAWRASVLGLLRLLWFLPCRHPITKLTRLRADAHKIEPPLSWNLRDFGIPATLLGRRVR